MSQRRANERHIRAMQAYDKYGWLIAMQKRKEKAEKARREKEAKNEG